MSMKEIKSVYYVPILIALVSMIAGVEHPFVNLIVTLLMVFLWTTYLIAILSTPR